MAKLAIQARNISKRYRLGVQEEKSDSLVGAATSFLRAPVKNFQRLRRLRKFSETDTEAPDILWALRDVSFDIAPGDVVGFIGKNGAGKSTLLKILSRITDPTSGEVRINGRVSSLLEVGTGFHPELTGRENVFLNGTILGMSRKEIARKFDEIVDFAGVEKFIDTPVKRYSSGMTVRLAFAVAAHLEPEILIVDEVLAVGDAQFQQKSIGKMQDVARDEGRTVLFVSHNMAAIQNLCRKVVLLERGKVVMIGKPEEAIREYLREFSEARASNDLSDIRRKGNGAMRFTSYQVTSTDGLPLQMVQSGQDIVLNFGYETIEARPESKVNVGFGVHGPSGERLFVIYSSHTGVELSPNGRAGVFRCVLERLPLNPGRYSVIPRIEVDQEEADFPQEPVGFIEVEAGDFYGTGKVTHDRGASPFLVNARWDGIESGLVGSPR